MQTIYKTATTSNFTIIANDLVNSSIPPTPQKILLYLLSKPVTWQLKTHDLSKQLGLTAYAIKKALRWLCQAGFAAYTRLKSGHTIWRIFDKPQAQTAYSLAIPPQVEIPQVAFQPDIVKTETALITETTTPPIVQTEKAVVVSDSDLTYPVQLSDTQKKAAKHIIRKAPLQLQQPVLFALAYAMAQNKVKSAPAYLQGLVTRANNGTFESIAGGGTKTPKPQIWQGHQKTPPIDNNSFFQELISKFGNKAKLAIPVEF